MKTTSPTLLRSLRVFLLGGCLTLVVAAMDPLQAEPAGDSATEAAGTFSPADLEKLVGPIALYPDALVALILPAATVPTDITLAARSLQTHPGADQIDAQPWSDSVKALARYPEVVQWMNENLAWTASLGDAFIAQPEAVMNTIQTLRKKARAAGHLKDTPQQTVVEEVVDGITYLRIVPAEPTTIYVPTYDPQIVYYPTPSYFVGNVISFGVGFVCGSWLTYDCDWRRQAIYCGPYRPRWNRSHHRRGYRHHKNSSDYVNVAHITPRSARRWQPSTRSRGRAARRTTALHNQYRRTSLPTPRHFSTTQGQYGSHGIQRSASAPWGSRTRTQRQRTSRVDAPPNLNLTTRSPNPQQPHPTRRNRVSQNAQVPNAVHRNLVVPTAPKNSPALQGNRHSRRTATDSRVRPTRTVPVGFDHSRFRVVRPPTTRTTISTPHVSQPSGNRFQPQTRGTATFQTTGARHPAATSRSFRRSAIPSTGASQGRFQVHGTSGQWRGSH